MSLENKSFEVTISISPESAIIGQKLLITTVVKNVSSIPGRFCVYHTPFEGIMNDIFNLTLGGEEIPYVGVLASRRPPMEEDYCTLSPSEEKACTVELEGYELEKKGVYELRYDTNFDLPASNIVHFKII